MKATWYDAQGAARDVLVVGEMHDPEPGPGEVRIRIPTSGVNPGDVKKRQDAYGYGMAYARVIPHSDGAGPWQRRLPGRGEGRRGTRFERCPGCRMARVRDRADVPFVGHR